MRLGRGSFRLLCAGFVASLPCHHAARAQAVEAARPPVLAMRDGRPLVTLLDGNLTIAPTLRADVDMGGFFNQPIYSSFPNPTKYLSQSERTGMPDMGVNIRRFRTGLQGTYLRDFGYTFTWEFAQAPGTQFSPVTLSRLFELQTFYTGWSWGTPRIGAFTLNHTLIYAMSSFERTFMEAPAIINIAASLASGNARLAVGGEAHGERWFAAAYASDGQTTVINDGRQRGIVGRGNYRVLDTEGARVIIGANAAAQFAPGTKGAPGSFDLRDYPELRLDPSRLLATGTLRHVATGSAVGPELQAMLGPVYLQAEYQALRVAFSTSTSNRNFRGYYIDASMPLLGPPRRYDPRRGIFARPRVEDFNPAAGQWGWLELAARWSWVSLNDAPTHGGSQGVAAVALNWYPTSKIRVTAEYLNGVVRLLPGSGNSSGADRAFQAVVGRLAFNW
jgi:phosphate-selective porin OprO/OprP